MALDNEGITALLDQLKLRRLIYQKLPVLQVDIQKLSHLVVQVQHSLCKHQIEGVFSLSLLVSPEVVI